MFEEMMFNSVTFAGGAGLLMWVSYKLYNYQKTEAQDWPAVCVVFAIAATLMAAGSNGVWTTLSSPYQETTRESLDFMP